MELKGKEGIKRNGRAGRKEEDSEGKGCKNAPATNSIEIHAKNQLNN